LCATENARLEIASWLIEHGADLNVQDNHGRTALWQAATLQQLEIAKKLLRAGADPNLADEEGRTPLIRTASMGHRARLEELYTPQAHLVTDQPERADAYLEIASLLIERGADVNAKEWEFGGTALHIAAGWGHEAMAKLLLANGAHINTMDYYGKNGRTPLDEARRNGKVTMVELLLKYGAKDGVAGG